MTPPELTVVVGTRDRPDAVAACLTALDAQRADEPAQPGTGSQSSSRRGAAGVCGTTAEAATAVGFVAEAVAGRP